MLGLLYPHRRKANSFSSSRPALRLSLLPGCMKRHSLLLPPRVKVVTSPIKKKNKTDEDTLPPSLRLDSFTQKEIETAINRVYEDGARARKLSYLLGLLDR